ncbi:MAG: ABC transporter substrate-binding protein [Alphaproteobacteria bacterium]|nr:ABC transporter substrate-binding protein [Alphaproteobacteria bacterium]
MKKILVFVLAALSLVACDKNDNPQNKPVVKIGIMLPLSGEFASYGDASKRAIEMVKQDVKDAKNHYQFVLEDSGTDSAKAATIIRKLVFTDKINAVMGYISSTAMVVAPIAQENKIPSVFFVSAPEASIGEYNFRLYPDIAQAAKMISQKVKAEKKKNIALIYQDIPSMDYMVKDMLPVLQNELHIVIKENFLPDEKNFFALLQKIKKSKPDYIVFEATPPASDIFMKQLYENNINIPVTGFQLIGMITKLEGLDKMWDVDTPTANSEFMARYKNMGGDDNLYYADYVYTMLMALVNGFENASTDNMDEFIAAAAKTNSPIGQLKVNADKDLLINNHIYQQVVDGKKENMEK